MVLGVGLHLCTVGYKGNEFTFSYTADRLLRSSPSVLLRNNQHTSLIKFKVYNIDGFIYMYCEMITTIGLVDNIYFLIQVE